MFDLTCVLIWGTDQLLLKKRRMNILQIKLNFSGYFRNTQLRPEGAHSVFSIPLCIYPQSYNHNTMDDVQCFSVTLPLPSSICFFFFSVVPSVTTFLYPSSFPCYCTLMFVFLFVFICLSVSVLPARLPVFLHLTVTANGCLLGSLML